MRGASEMKRRLVPIATCGIVAVAVSGCSVSFSSGGTTIKQEDLINDVQNFMTQQLPDLPATKSVDCPGDVDAKVGTTFECTATLTNGQDVTIPLQVKAVSDDHGSIQSNPDIADSALAVDLLYKDAPATPKTVDCPTGISAKVGKTFVCKSSLTNGANYTVTVKITKANPDGDQFMTIVSAKQT